MARIFMVNDGLAGPCTDNVGVAYSVGALRSMGGGAWVVCVAVCCGCFLGVSCFAWGDFVVFLLWGDPGGYTLEMAFKKTL